MKDIKLYLEEIGIIPTQQGDTFMSGYDKMIWGITYMTMDSEVFAEILSKALK